MSTARHFPRAIALAVLVIASTLAASPAASQPPAVEATDGDDRALFLSAQLGFGYWHYFQTDYADREFGGGSAEARFAVGGWFRGGFTVGGEISPIAYFPTKGHADREGDMSSPAGGGIMFGPMAAWIPELERPPVAIRLAAGFTGDGAPGTWGGYGPYVSPSLSVFFGHFGRVHLGGYLRLIYARLFSSDAQGAKKNFLMITLGVDVTVL
jgi:hypothetical protein